MQTALFNKNFKLYLVGVVASNFGNSLSSVVYALLVYQITHSSTAMGITLALSVIPTLFSPLFGVWVDRLRTQPILVALNLVQGLGMALLALLYFLELPLLNWLYAVAFLNGLAMAAYVPAAGTVLPRIVDKEQIPRAAGLLGASNQSAYLGGYLAGAAFIALLGPALTLALDALSFAVLAYLITQMRFKELEVKPKRVPYWTAFASGIGVVAKTGLFAYVPLVAFALNAAMAPTEMFLPRHLTQMGQEVSGFGVFMALMMAGMVLASSAVVWLGSRFVPRFAVGVGTLFLALSLFGVAWSKNPSVYAWAVPYGFGLAFANSAFGILAQTVVSQEYRGRVIGLVNATAHSGLPLCLILLSPVADKLASSSVLLGAGGLLLGVGAVWFGGTARFSENRRAALEE